MKNAQYSFKPSRPAISLHKETGFFLIAPRKHALQAAKSQVFSNNSAYPRALQKIFHFTAKISSCNLCMNMVGSA
jgi:hypothetical protein